MYYFSQGIPCNEYRVPAMRTGVPCNENRFFPVRIYYTGKTLFWPCTGPVRDCSAWTFQPCPFQLSDRIKHEFVSSTLQTQTLYSLQGNPVSQFPQGKPCFHYREPLFSLQGPCFHYRDFPVNPCTSLLRIAVLAKFFMILFWENDKYALTNTAQGSILGE